MLEEGYGNNLHDEHHKAYHPDCPRKANFLQKLLDDDWKDKSTSGTSRSTNSYGQCSFGSEISRKNSERWTKEQSVANTRTYALGEKELPVPTFINEELRRGDTEMTYLVDKEVIKTPSSMKKEPNRIVGLNKPKSVALPAKVPIKKSKKIWTLPTQLISDGG